jgi:hypothetical protein
MMLIGTSGLAADECPTFYRRYLNQLPKAPVLDLLASQAEELATLLERVGEDGAGYRYAPGKWTIRDVAGHLADAERIFAYRALRFARHDPAPLSGFDENEYVRSADFERRPLHSIARELHYMRQANLELFRSFDTAELLRRGMANGQEISVRALIAVIAGHERHHLRILGERYLRE